MMWTPAGTCQHAGELWHETLTSYHHLQALCLATSLLEGVLPCFLCPRTAQPCGAVTAWARLRLVGPRVATVPPRVRCGVCCDCESSQRAGTRPRCPCSEEAWGRAEAEKAYVSKALSSEA